MKVLLILGLVQYYMIKMSNVRDMNMEVNVEIAQLQLENEWRKNKFVKDIFVVDGTESCKSKDESAEPLFSYDWQGLRPHFYRDTYKNPDGKSIFFEKCDGSGKQERCYGMLD